MKPIKIGGEGTETKVNVLVVKKVDPKCFLQVKNK